MPAFVEVMARSPVVAVAAPRVTAPLALRVASVPASSEAMPSVPPAAVTLAVRPAVSEVVTETAVPAFKVASRPAIRVAAVMPAFVEVTRGRRSWRWRWRG